jgi:hypothetical protein
MEPASVDSSSFGDVTDRILSISHQVTLHHRMQVVSGSDWRSGEIACASQCMTDGEPELQFELQISQLESIAPCIGRYIFVIKTTQHKSGSCRK